MLTKQAVYGNIKTLRARSSVAEQAAHNRLVEGSNSFRAHLSYIIEGP